MKSAIVSAILVIIGLVNLAPVVGVFSSDALSRAYGLERLSGDLLLLMRHRALLFGILGTLVLVSVGMRPLQLPMLLAALVSMLGFVAIVGITPANPSLQTIVVVDVVASVLALVATVFRLAESIGN